MAKNGDLYFSHSTSEYGINRVALTSFPNPSGRLIHYSRATGKITVILDKLWFANGIALPKSEEFVVVADSFSLQIVKVWLKGPKAGSKEIFIDGIPGSPDNLSYDDDGIWVAIATAADDKHPMVSQQLAMYPTARKFIGRLLELVKLPFEFINSIYPNSLTDTVCRSFGSMDMITFLFPARSTVLRLNWDGKIVKAYHGMDDSTGVVTHVMKHNGYLYLGSVIREYIARVKIDA